ncbi:MAG: hypothetical protein IKS56_00140 [Lachnospiraceae bacterium]|nr:hypothetical protein [Lachnospiraceae bacterium]
MMEKTLYKIELYRFLKSLWLFLLLSAASLIMMILINTDSSSFETTQSTVGNLQSVFKIMGIFFCIAAAIGISVYTGREYKNKTIYHEIMKGYSLVKIAVSKAIGCGLIFAFILWCAVFTFLAVNKGYLTAFSPARFILLYVYMFHICSCTLMYVMLLRNGAVGGCLAFCRFVFFEICIAFFALVLPDKILIWVKGFLTFTQWSYLTTPDVSLPLPVYIGVILSTIAELVILSLLLSFNGKRIDY